MTAAPPAWRGPDFFLVGAAKSGTTALATALGRHPGVFLPPLKEPHFYAYLADPTSIGPTYRDDDDARRRYHDLYAGASGAGAGVVAVGDASTSNLTVIGAAAAIAGDVPGARIVAVLRHPVDRAFSAWSHFRAAGAESLDFAAAVAAEPERLAAGYPPPYQFLGRGFYSGQLGPYYDLFGRDRVLVHLYDDLVEDSAAVLRATLRFLGAEIPPRLAPVTRENEIRAPRGGVLRRALPRRLRYHPKPRIDPALRARLVEDVLGDELDRLETLLGRDLSGWR